MALRKQHKLLLQHITSRGSRLAPLKQRRPLASSSASSSPTSPPPPFGSLASSGPESDVGWGGGGTLGGKSPLDVTGPSLPHRSPRRVASLSSTTCRPNKSSSPLTPSPAQEQHAVLWCAPAPLPLLPFSAFLQPTTGTE